MRIHGAPASSPGPTDNTLEIDTDSGTQKRLLHFAAPGAPAPSAVSAQSEWRGYSVAQWAGDQHGPRGPHARSQRQPAGVVTTKMKAGYLRKNGVPCATTRHAAE